MTNMAKESQEGVADQQKDGPPDEPNGFFERFATRGYDRVIKGVDLYLSVIIAVVAYSVSAYTNVKIVKSGFVSAATPLAISLIAFILVGVSVLVSFSDEKFLALLKKLEIYNTILFNFEFGMYLALVVSVAGIILQAYSAALNFLGIFAAAFYIFLFLFFYMCFAAANIVSSIVSIGSRKARIALTEQD